MIPIPSFRTSRLVFRAIESPLDDEFLVDLFGSDAAGQFGWTDEPVVPWSKKHVEDFHKAIEKAALPVMICLPEEDGDNKKTGRAIGCVILHKIHPIHRSAYFGIAVHRDFQVSYTLKVSASVLLLTGASTRRRFIVDRAKDTQRKRSNGYSNELSSVLAVIVSK